MALNLGFEKYTGRHYGSPWKEYTNLGVLYKSSAWTLYQAENINNGELYFIKQLSSPKKTTRTDEELQWYKKIDHPSFMKIYDIYLESKKGKEYPYIIMDF